jgi:hypothetical protein
MENKHADEFIKKAAKIKKDGRWSLQQVDGPTGYVKCYSTNIYTNLIQRTFSKKYLSQHPCACGKPSTDRCHGIGEERPLLLQRALDKIRFPTTHEEIIVAFLLEHVDTGFSLKCKTCHQTGLN